jgi:hypothetical protein
MRVLTVRQPWAWAIIHGGKDIENRVRNIAGDYRGPVAIHAGLADYEQDNIGSRTHRAAHGTETETRMDFGAIIGVVDLVDVHKPGESWKDDESGFCSAWAERGAFHLELENPRPLAHPIPFKGALGLRTLPADVEAAVREQVQ